MTLRDNNRFIKGEISVDAPIDLVWEAWTTEEGIKSFFAPACNINLKVGGLFEILFNPQAEPGSRGAENIHVMAFQPKKMLAFTWSAPPHMPRIREQRTHVVIRFAQINGQQTRITLHHDGWGDGNEWDEAFEYFENAWNTIVLPRLKYRFEKGPIDWNNVPELP